MQDVRSSRVTYKNNTQKTWYKEVGKRRPRCRFEDIEIYLTQGVWKGVDWIHLVQVKEQGPLLVNTVRIF
jgi:hypothetical protein